MKSGENGQMNKCTRCGLCCYWKWVFVYKGPSKSDDTWRSSLVVSDPCEHLITVNELPTCTIYENRPDECRERPGLCDQDWSKSGENGWCNRLDPRRQVDRET